MSEKTGPGLGVSGDACNMVPYPQSLIKIRGFEGGVVIVSFKMHHMDFHHVFFTIFQNSRLGFRGMETQRCTLTKK